MSAAEKNSRGGARPGAGRKKGIGNRRSWNMRLELEAAGFEPLPELLKILRETTDQDKRWERIAWMVQYIYPKLKETEQLPEPPEEEDNPASKRDTEALLKLALEDAAK